MNDDLMTTKEVMAYLKVSRSSLFRYIKQGLPIIRMGKSKCPPNRFRKSEVDAWMASNSPSPGGINAD